MRCTMQCTPKCFEFVDVLKAVLKTMMNLSQMELGFKKCSSKSFKQRLSENSTWVFQIQFLVKKLIRILDEITHFKI